MESFVTMLSEDYEGLASYVGSADRLSSLSSGLVHLIILGCRVMLIEFLFFAVEDGHHLTLGLGETRFEVICFNALRRIVFCLIFLAECLQQLQLGFDVLQ